MRFSRSTRFVATVTGAFALSLLTGPLLAAPERRASSPRVAPRSLAQPKVGVVSSGRQLRAKSATAYWTPRRMANAKPVRLAKAGRLHAASAPKARAARRVVRIPGTLGAAAGGAGSSGEEPTPLHATSVPRPYTNYPDRLNGKVFFSKPGGNFVCSGTAVNSENKSIVWTAGHCVEDGSSGGFHSNWVFVPAYNSSSGAQRPYGTWSAKELWTTSAWASTGNFRQDVGAVVVNRVNNIRLVDRIGGQGIKFNASRNLTYNSFGYPQASPFNGLFQWRCNSGYLGSDSPPGSGPLTMKIHCNMTGGSSGGGWLTGLNSSGLGFVTSVNSYGYSSLPDNMFGPYHGAAAKGLYDAVRNRPA